MASSLPPSVSRTDQSYTEMSKGDVEAIGAHCQLEYCHVLDFLPFTCRSCRGTYCLDHRTETAHKCPNPGEWARSQRVDTKTALVSKPSTHECDERTCKTLMDTNRTITNHCQTCNYLYCLKHRMPEDHDCKNRTPKGARPSNILQQQRERGVSALAKLKVWAAEKRATKESEAKQKNGIFSVSRKSPAARLVIEVNEMKKTAKGDASVPRDKRIYLTVEASADTTKAKHPTGKFYYNKDWTVGRVLDMAAKSLQVENVNNRGGGEEEKLRVFHVEGGRLLKFTEKIGTPCASGNTIVLLRGVGSGELDLIDLSD